MEEMLHNMFQYKNKLDHLKQEKSELTVSYEVNLQCFFCPQNSTHILIKLHSRVISLSFLWCPFLENANVKYEHDHLLS